MATAKFTPVELAKGSARRIAQSAEEETRLRFAGWHSPNQIKPGERRTAESEAQKPAAPKKS